ncbi:MAG: ABC transporter permease, partial [Brachybacterium sp.]|nr:ABC transporter permease [Brachybacterium sp.]
MRPDIDLRSYLDTRGAAILLTLSLLVLVAFAALGGLIQPAVIPEGIADVEITFIVLSLPLSLIIPVFAVMMTAGEWSDRSIQNTFLQRPGRLGVLASKVIAAVAVVVALVAVSIGLAAGATWIGGELMGEGAVFSSFESLLTTQLPILAAILLFSLAMGILLQSTVISLVIAIGLPFVISTAGVLTMTSGSELISDIVRAVDLTAAAAALGDGTAGAFELL